MTVYNRVMTVVFLTRFFWPHVGGVERHVLEVGQELVKLGHQITVITLKHETKLANEQTYRGLKIIRLPYSDSKWGIWRSLWQHRKVLKDVAVTHCHDVFFWYLPFRFFWPKKPVFTTFHGWEGVYPVPKKNILAHRLAEKLSRGNICIGDYLPIHYGTKADFISYGAITFSYSDRAMKALREIIFIGRLEKENAIEEYLAAIKLIRRKYRLPVTFVGDGQYRRQVARLGRVTGMVANIKPYLNRPAAILAASYLTIWEALAANRPVFSLYQNQLKKDYLEKFPAASAIYISGSAEGLLKQFEQARKNQLPIDRLIGNSWEQVAAIYLKLWQK